MTDTDKEFDLLKEYMLYYVDVLAHNAVVNIRNRQILADTFYRWERFGIMLIERNVGPKMIIPMEFELWKNIYLWGKDRNRVFKTKLGITKSINQA
jgi:hypothetical protein